MKLVLNIFQHRAFAFFKFLYFCSYKGAWQSNRPEIVLKRPAAVLTSDICLEITSSQDGRRRRISPKVDPSFSSFRRPLLRLKNRFNGENSRRRGKFRVFLCDRSRFADVRRTTRWTTSKLVIPVASCGPLKHKIWDFEGVRTVCSAE